ncbi:DUF1223 domain-containing protein [Roseobacter ponti]|uniref:DUF1223 domain-containing protein n=1 Tax=Roseobacter ponti TaxID=1891787 RepID=A0A858SUP2_9RHOB|nr:DUF1223 domain-containing protein [Roseobacter ponti]QJF51542.1 DUF1223 domain-containing protein [Roseobacter ponti]
MRRLMQAIFAGALFISPLQAQDAPVVVELYTSQGCSSCPPADDLFHQIAGRDDVIALALHVDYWDYIGWKDQFADPRNAQRQRAYATAAGRRSIYTPEMIVNGLTDIIGAKPMQLSEAIAAHKAQPAPVLVSLRRNGESVQISAEAKQPPTGALIVQMVRYVPEREADITRGENAGRRIVYSNVTQDWKILGEWDGRAPLDIEAPAPGAEAVVVLIQEKGMGPIVGAAQLR